MTSSIFAHVPLHPEVAQVVGQIVYKWAEIEREAIKGIDWIYFLANSGRITHPDDKIAKMRLQEPVVQQNRSKRRIKQWQLVNMAVSLDRAQSKLVASTTQRLLKLADLRHDLAHNLDGVVENMPGFADGITGIALRIRKEVSDYERTKASDARWEKIRQGHQLSLIDPADFIGRFMSLDDVIARNVEICDALAAIRKANDYVHTMPHRSAEDRHRDIFPELFKPAD